MTPPQSGGRGGGYGTRGRASQARPMRSEGEPSRGGRPGARSGGRPQREPGTETPLVAAAQILLGITLSCAIAMGILIGLIGVVFLIAYMFK